MFSALVGLTASWNAAHPLIDPTRRYSPWWLPAMVVAELAPLWLLFHVVVVAITLLAGGLHHVVARIALAMLGVSMVLLGWTIVRSRLGVSRLRPLLDVAVQPARGAARVLGRPIPTPPGVRERSAIAWRDGLTLDLIGPSERPSGPPASAPVLVYVHGGGWTGGDPQLQARDLYHALALVGWTTAAIRYPFTPAVTVEDQIATVRASVRWVRTELGEHHVVASHVALAGGSAGGHLASMAALTAFDPIEQVDACVGIYGVYDMANRNRTRAPWTKIRREVMMAAVDEAPDRYRAVSPLDRIHDASPPMLIVHGTHDTLVPVAEGQQFVAALRAAGRPVDFVPVYGAQHAFDALSSITSRTAAAVISTWLLRTVIDGGASSKGQAPTA